MKLVKALVVAALVTAVSAQAATYYRDRYIPAGAPCMVKFAGRHINAAQVQDVAIGTWIAVVKNPDESFSASRWLEKPYKALRVTFANTQYFQLVDQEPYEPKRDALLADIAACGKPIEMTGK